MRRARWLTAVWVTLTLAGLGMPSSGLPDPPTEWTDKVIHVVIFAAGTILAIRGWPQAPWLVLLALVLFAPLTEAWQAALPTGRSAEVLDVVANLVGIASGVVLACPRRTARKQRYAKDSPTSG